MGAGGMRARLDALRASVEEAAGRAGRTDGVTIVAVSKTVEAARIKQAVEAGQRVFGENRVQEAVPKIEALHDVGEDLSWHLIGHLQTNKAKAAATSFSCVQSVDSVRLALALDRQARSAGKILPILLEINVGGEASKTGFHPEAALHAAEDIASLECVRVHGLMTIAPLAQDPEEVRWVFRLLRELRDTMRERPGLQSCTELSMGMSNDFTVAVEEGATMVRIGRALFGDRPSAL